MNDVVSLAVLPVLGWSLTKIVQHEKKIAVMEQVAVDIRNSLQRLEGILDKDQSRRHSR